MTNYLNILDRYNKNTFKFRQSILDTLTETDTVATEYNLSESFYSKSFSGSFHKTLPHNNTTGDLIEPEYYLGYVCALLNNQQELLENVKLHPNSTMKLVNPLAALSTPIDKDYCKFNVDNCPEIYENCGVAEMLEIYSMAYLRDINFSDYPTNNLIERHIKLLNNSNIISNLLFRNKINFTPNTLFRSSSFGCEYGPYISQFLYKKINIGPFSYEQKFKLPPTRSTKSEWGVDSLETIDIQNGNLSNLAPFTLDQTLKYIRNGKDLGEVVHNDQAYQLFYHTASILLNIGAKPNPGLATFKNQTGFATSFGGPAIYNNLGTVTELALCHCWYWKWLVYRKIRPDAFSLLIHNTKNKIKKYNLPELLLNNEILEDIKTLYGNYTLPMSYREGSPVHPSYPSGHATIAGACITLLKVYFDGNQKLNILTNIVVPDNSGDNLISYSGNDINDITIDSELNKLAANVAYGRNWAGVHYRSDAEAGMKLGEDIVISWYQNVLSNQVENKNGKLPVITIKKLNGELFNIVPAVAN